MALTPERHAEVDTDLQHIKQFLVALAEEIEAAALATGKRCFG